MQSTGHASTQAVSLVLIQGSAITYAMSFYFYPPITKLNEKRHCSKVPRAMRTGLAAKRAFCAVTGSSYLLGTHQFLARLILHDVACDRARGDRQRRSQIHLPRSAASGEVPVLRADYNLFGTGRDSWTGVDASPTTGFDDMRSGFLKNIQI